MQNDKNNKEQFDNLVNNPVFIKSCIEVSKKLGVTADQWNRDKGFYIGVLAIEFLNNANKGA
jgi:hypothetical protein